VLVLAVWPFFELLFNSLVGLVDTGLAGRLSADIRDPALDAIGLSAFIQWLLGLLAMSIGTGAGALIARAVGARRLAVANAGLGQALLLAVVWGFVAGGAIYGLAWPIVDLFRLPEPSQVLAVEYLRVVSLAAPLSSILFVGNGCLRAAGDTRTPFIAMVVVNIVNIAASVLLVFGPAPLGGHDVQGIAAGTAIGWTVGAVIVLGVLVSGAMPIRLRLRRLRPHGHTIRRIVRIALPSLIEAGGMWAGNVVVARFVGEIADRTDTVGVMGAHIIAVRIESLSFMPGVAIGMAAATLTGQYLGAGDPKRAKQAGRLCWVLGAGIMGLFGVAFVVIPGPLVWILAPEAETVANLAIPALMICGPVQVFFGTYMVLSKALRGAGDTFGPMVLTYLTTFGVRLPLAWVLGIGLGLGLTGIWLGLCAELVVRGIVYAWRYERDRWMTLRV
jgi:putative MATE family efflux protein